MWEYSATISSICTFHSKLSDSNWIKVQFSHLSNDILKINFGKQKNPTKAKLLKFLTVNRNIKRDKSKERKENIEYNLNKAIVWACSYVRNSIKILSSVDTKGRSTQMFWKMMTHFIKSVHISCENGVYANKIG